MSRTRYIGDIDELCDETYEQCDIEDVNDLDIPNALLDTPSARRVDVIQSPYMNTYFNQHPVRLTLDTGTTI